VTLLAAVGSGVDGVAEGCRSGPLDVEDDVLGLHALMAAVAVGGDGKGPFTVVAGTAGPSFFHLGHGYGSFFSGYDLSIVAAPAGTAGLCDMGGVTEGRLTEPLDLVGHVTRIAFVALGAVFLAGDAECLHPAVTGAAALGLFHLGHGKVPAVPHVEDGIMADLAVILVFVQMVGVAEYDRIGVFEGELDILGLCRTGTDCRQQHDRTGEQRKLFVHRFHSSELK